MSGEALQCGQPSGGGVGRIVNGSDTGDWAQPWSVQIRTKYGKVFCSGSLITAQLVVTAASPGVKKYARKHKTENLNGKLEQMENQQDRHRTQSLSILSIPHTRKSTFMENVSNLLNYIKH